MVSMDFSSTISFDKVGPLLWNLAESYLHITNTTFQVSSIQGRTISVKENDEDTSSLLVKALKIISYATIVPPLVALAVKATYRRKYIYKIAYSFAEIGKEIKTDKNEEKPSSYSLFSRPQLDILPDITTLGEILSSKKNLLRNVNRLIKLYQSLCII
jgi:hypothetical protein